MTTEIYIEAIKSNWGGVKKKLSDTSRIHLRATPGSAAGLARPPGDW